MSAGFRCYITHMFTGAIAYANNIALMAPSVRAMIRCVYRYSKGFNYAHFEGSVIRRGDHTKELTP